MSVPPRPVAVFVLRCTQKLLDRLNVKFDPEPAQSDTVLGDWYANLVRVGRVQVVLGVSDRSLLPVVVPAKEGRSLVQRLREVLEPTLTTIGVPFDDLISEKVQQRWISASQQDLRGTSACASRSLSGAMQTHR